MKGDGLGSNWVSLCSARNRADAQERAVSIWPSYVWLPYDRVSLLKQGLHFRVPGSGAKEVLDSCL